MSRALLALPLLSIFLLVVIGLASCSVSTVEVGTEAVVVKKPYFFGSAGVDPTPVGAGRYFHVRSTSYVPFNIRPVRIDENFPDLITSDNVPVQFHCSVTLNVVPGKSPGLLQAYGPNWYETNVEQPFRTMVRDFARGHKVFQLTTDPKVTADGQNLISQQLMALIEEKKLPIVIDQVVIGSVTPPAEVLAETARTAAQDQRARTESTRATAELSRKQAEENKADADKAYAAKFGMTAREFLVYRSLEIQRELVEVVKDKENVSVLVTAGGQGSDATPMFKVGN